MARNLDGCLPLLVMLTQATRVATEEQIDTFAQLYSAFQAPCPAAATRLVASGLLTCQDLAIRTPMIDSPLFSWKIDDAAPEFDALAAHLVRRLDMAPWRRTRLFWATRKAVNLVGGASGLNRQPLQLQHDLSTTAVYLKFLERESGHPDEFWVGEDALRREYPNLFRRKRPDAAVLKPPDLPTLIIETGGNYSADDLRHIHRSYVRERIPYELW